MASAYHTTDTTFSIPRIAVLELLKEEKTLSQLASEHQVHPNQLRQWRDLVLKQLSSLFDKKNQAADLLATHEQQVEELYAEIGKLQAQLSWLKKKSGIDPSSR